MQPTKTSALLQTVIKLASDPSDTELSLVVSSLHTRLPNKLHTNGRLELAVDQITGLQLSLKKITHRFGSTVLASTYGQTIHLHTHTHTLSAVYVSRYIWSLESFTKLTMSFTDLLMA